MPWGAMCAGAGDWKLEPASEPYCEIVSMGVAGVYGKGMGIEIDRRVVGQERGVGNVQLVVEGLLLEDRISVVTSCTLSSVPRELRFGVEVWS